MVDQKFEEPGSFLDWIAVGCYTVGATGFLMCGDHAQTSLKTVALMALACIIAVPFYSYNIGRIVYYILLVLLWCYTLYLIWCKKDSVLKRTYDKKLDSFPHWLLCFVPAVVATVCIIMFLEYGLGGGSFAFCKDYYQDDKKFCTNLTLHLFSALLDAVAFIPQVYIVFKVWAGHSRESAGLERKVYFKVKVFLAFMFAFFVFRGLYWIRAASSYQILDTDVFLVFFCSNIMGALVTASPWICRATYMQCCGRTTCGCCIKDPSEENPGAGPNREVNTGQTNDNALADEEERKSRGSILWSLWSWFSSFSPKEPTTTENEPRDEEERDVGVEMPTLSIGSATDLQPSSLGTTNSTLGSSPATTSTNSNLQYAATATPTLGTYSHSNTAAAAGDDQPDWLQD